MPGYIAIKRKGVKFFFKKDPADPSILHIYARHLKHPADAMRVWFGGRHTWNGERKRFKAELEGVGIYWFWRDHQNDHVLIISCFTAID